MSSLTASGAEAQVLPAKDGQLAPADRPCAAFRAARAAGGVSLVGLVASSLLVVVIAAERPSFLAPISRPGFFPGWMAGPLRGLWPGLTRNGVTLEWLVSGVMVCMYALYVIAFTNAPRLRARWTLATVAVIHLVFMLAPPLSYTDVFNYINYGRMGVVHHLNPYSTIPALEPHSDPSFALSNWHHLLSPYGPLFTFLTYALVPLGVTASFWALKLVLGIASLGMLALVWRCAQLVGRSPASAVMFAGGNPIVLIWGLGADHNDALMMFFVMLAVYLGLRRRRTSGSARTVPALRVPALGAGAAIALVTAVSIKASAAVLAPIFLVLGCRRRFLAGGLVAIVAIEIASLLVLGPQIPDLATQSRLVTAVGIPNLVGLALGQGGETRTLHAIFNLIVVLAVATCTVWTVRRGRDWLPACAVAMLVLVVCLSWAAPWYLLWALPFAALSHARRLRGAVIVLGAYFILAFMPAAVALQTDLHLRPTATRLGMLHQREIGAVFR
ncbi:MAG: putative hexosyltransferase [Solirubrobacteraceae bacterium]